MQEVGEPGGRDYVTGAEAARLEREAVERLAGARLPRGAGTSRNRSIVDMPPVPLVEHFQD